MSGSDGQIPARWEKLQRRGMERSRWIIEGREEGGAPRNASVQNGVTGKTAMSLAEREITEKEVGSVG